MHKIVLLHTVARQLSNFLRSVVQCTVSSVAESTLQTVLNRVMEEHAKG